MLRPYDPGDREAVLDLDFETGFLGSSLAPLVERREIFTRSLDWYLRNFPATAFVAETAGLVRGYVASSSRDVRASAAIASITGTLSDVARIPWLGKKDRHYLLSRLETALRSIAGDARRFRTPCGPRLHINLHRSLRGGGVGSLLLGLVTERLRVDGARVVHANAYQSELNDASPFWIRNGFEEFSRVRTTAWAKFVEERVDLVCWARHL